MARDIIKVIDSHTAGEATRVVCQGGPSWDGYTAAQWRDLLSARYDHYRRALLHEPRGFPAMVGAWLGPPTTATAAASVVFFNNTGYLGMCVHGAIGVAVTLARLGRIDSDTFDLDTPVGTVSMRMHSDGTVSVRNVASRCYRRDVTVVVPGHGQVTGDVAWGGNWFFLVNEPQMVISPDKLPVLLDAAKRIRQALEEQHITGEHQAVIDHIEFFGAPSRSDCHSRNFVLCPGGEYDRSPCGTGTSAKVACLASRAELAPGQTWRQQGILGTYFEAHYQSQHGQIFPVIRGSAFITAEAEIILDNRDPFRYGIVP